MPAPRLIVLCDAGGPVGMGHLMRSVALVEEALARGWSVQVLGELDPIARDLLGRLVPEAEVAGPWPADGAPLGAGLGAEVLHLDTYRDLALSAGPWLVSSMQDGTFGRRSADLVIDAGLGAERRLDEVGAGRPRHVLLGPEVAPVRRDVRRQARSGPITSPVGRLLVVLGGTDPFDLTPRVVAALAALERPLEVTVVAPAARHAAVERAAADLRHQVRVLPFVPDLPAAAAAHDLVISAAGTSVHDLAHQGVPMALLCVTDNQVPGYRAALQAGLAVGLGEPPHADLRARVGELAGLVDDPVALERLHATGRQLVDGLGAWRIVSAWEQLTSAGPTRGGLGPEQPEVPRLSARRAAPSDAEMLLDWRNDPRTRAGSRRRAEIAPAEHLAWLDRVLADPDRQLWIVASPQGPVGSVRWDRVGERDWEVAITLAPPLRGRGLALALLRAGEDALEVEDSVRLIAVVHRENEASRRLFARAGYLPLIPADADGFATSTRWRPATPGPRSAPSHG